MAATSPSELRLRLIEQVLRLPEPRLKELGHALDRIVGEQQPFDRIDWPHAPPHRLSERGTYIVTAGTYGRDHLFRGGDRLDHLQAALLSLANEMGWQLEAWAVFSNHYHFVAHAEEGAISLRDLIQRLHRETALWVNRRDGVAGRAVWHNFWDTQLTFEKSYLARLNYVMQNPVKHGLVTDAKLYPWCSAAWFERTATPAQVQTVASFKIDRVHVEDDFEPV